MKNFMLSLLALSAIVACQPEDNSNLAQLKTEKDSLSALQQEIALRMKDIDDEIVELDSTQKLSLITTFNVKPVDFKHYFSVYGIVESNQSISLYAEASGKIEQINVKRGQKVSKGQKLAQIDNEILVQNVQELKTNLELANKIYEKQSKLWLKDHIGSEVQYLEAKNNKESLDRKLATLQAQLAMTQVRAPFNGVVDEIFPKEGEMAGPQMPMFRLVNLKDVYLTASVSESYVGTINTGTPALVNFSSLDTTINSEVVRVGSFINPNNRTFDVNVALDAANNLKPNMMGEVKLEDYRADNAVVVPSRLIMENTEGESYLYTVKNESGNIAEVVKSMVVSGKSYDGFTQILSGLKGDEVLVDKGSRSVKDGQTVRLIKK